MHNIFRIQFLILVFLIHSLHFSEAAAQSNIFLDNFTLYINNDKVILDWTISGGNTCNGIKIYHSTDTILYTETGFIPGICGNSSTPVSYSFTDTNPVANRTNYYRLELGTLGFTDFVSIEYIRLNNSGFQVRPHPIRDEATVYFNNDLQKGYTFKLYDPLGKLVNTIENIFSDSFYFIRNDLPGGTYLFTLENQNEIAIKGKIIFL